MKKIQWGVLGAAIIATEQMIPAIRESNSGEVTAIASRSLEKARQVSERFNIPRYYEGYDALLQDPEVDAVYIPLPNHLHVPWAVKALRAGKHILVEKPVALNAEEGRVLWEEARKHPHLMVMEAFMYKFHPQWTEVKKFIDEGNIGTLKMIQSSFSFFDDHPDSIVNISQYGGGSLMDVGCYPVSVSRYLFEEEPHHVMASMEYDPIFGTDIHASGVLEFDKGKSIFFSSVQLTEHQEVSIFGTKGKIRFDIPFNPPADQPAQWIFETDERREIFKTESCNQYTAQVEAFSKAISEHTPLPFPLSDAIRNMEVIDALHLSAKLQNRVKTGTETVKPTN